MEEMYEPVPIWLGNAIAPGDLLVHEFMTIWVVSIILIFEKLSDLNYFSPTAVKAIRFRNNYVLNEKY